MLTQDLSPPSNHRSLVAVKEHGILMSIDSACASNAPEEQFWVIGLVNTYTVFNMCTTFNIQHFISTCPQASF